MKRQPFYLSPIFVVFVMAIFSFIALKSKYEEIMEKRNTVEEAKIKLERLIAKEELLNQIDPVTFKPKVELSIEAIPSEKDFPNFMATFDFLAKEASVSVVALQTSPGKVSTEGAKLASLAEKSESLPLNIVIEGKLENIKVFLNKMMTSLPLQSLQSFTFAFDWKSKGGDTQAKDVFGKVTANFAQAFYYSLLPKELGKVADPIPKLSKTEEDLFGVIGGYVKVPKGGALIPSGKEDPFSKL
jgi:hypothetical protein